MKPPKLAELAFSYSPRCPYRGVQAVGFLEDGRWFSVMQCPYDIAGKPNITYEMIVEGWQDAQRWMTPKDFDETVAESLETETNG